MTEQEADRVLALLRKYEKTAAVLHKSYARGYMQRVEYVERKTALHADLKHQLIDGEPNANVRTTTSR